VTIVSEIGIWMQRLMDLLPLVMNLWEAAKGGNPRQELDAQLALVRAMKDRQMKENLVDLSEPRLDE